MPPWNGGSSRELRCAVAREQRFERGQRAPVGRDSFDRVTAEPFDLSAAHHQRAGRRPADEREPTPALRVLDRLEQKAFSVADELDEHRERRLEIGEHFAPHRNDGVVARELDELGEAGLIRGPVAHVGEGVAHIGPGVAPLPNARKKHDRSPVWHAPRPTCSTTNKRTSMSQS